MNQHPLQSYSLLLALPGHACMHVRVPAAQLSTLSASVRSHSCIPSHAKLLNNVSHPSNRQLFTITVQYHSKSFSLCRAAISPAAIHATSPPLHHPCLPLQCVLQQLDEKWPGRGGWRKVASRHITDIHTHLQTHTVLSF